MPEWPSDKEFKTKIKTLRSRAAGRQFDDNFQLDIRLSDSAIANFIQAIRETDNDFSDIQRRLTEAARKYVNEGESVVLEETKVLGRVVPLTEFALLIKEQDVCNTITAAEAELRDYTQKSLDKIKIWLGNCWLSRKVSGEHLIMWATFDPKCSDDPFAGMTKEPVMIRAQLGMFKERSALILLYYKLPSGVKPHYPTTADAYAGTYWAAYWRPANSDNKWGSTQSWDSHPNVEPRSKVVHDPIQSTQLYKPCITGDVHSGGQPC